MIATLHIRANMSCELILEGVDLKEPTPQHPLLADDSIGFSYYGCVAVQTAHHWAGTTATITTVPHTGRGQTELFDKLVGPRIAALRLTMSREMRNITREHHHCEDQEIKVHLTHDDVLDIQNRIQTCADDAEITFFADSPFGLGRYTDERQLVWGRG